MRKILGVLVLILGIGTAAFAKPVYVGKEVTQVHGIETFVSYDTDFDWSLVENAEKGGLQDFYILQKDFDIQFEVGVTYTFSFKSTANGPSGVLTFQRLAEDTEGWCGNWLYVHTEE